MCVYVYINKKCVFFLFVNQVKTTERINIFFKFWNYYIISNTSTEDLIYN